jgi:putative Holliday junction resolvase
MKKEDTTRPKVRRAWTIKPFERIKESDKIYSRTREAEKSLRDNGEESEPRIIGLDLGEKRIGVAISDPLGITAQPVGVIPASDALETLKELRARRDAALFVIGYPLGLRGEAGQKAIEAQEFGKRLSEVTGVPHVLFDERLSSVAAQRALREMGVKPSRKKEAVDVIAAVLILQSYLDRKNRPDAGGEETDE